MVLSVAELGGGQGGPWPPSFEAGPPRITLLYSVAPPEIPLAPQSSPT